MTVSIHFQPTCDSSVRELCIDEDSINLRAAELESLIGNTKYSKQKESLKCEISSFLSCLNPPKLLCDALPLDVRKFLIFKDSAGKTQIHNDKCTNRGKQGKFECGCPYRRSAGSVDSLIGQVRAIFRDFGRGSDWNEILGIGNPAAAPIIKKYLAAIRLEQSLAAVCPKRAKPMFLIKLVLVTRHINYTCSNPRLTVLQKYTFLRDLTFFTLLAFSGDRAGDLGALQSNQMHWLPNKEGIIFSLVKGKTVDIRDPRVVIIFNADVEELCPLKKILSYIDFCEKNNINLNSGFFFRPLSASQKEISDVPFSSSTANSRLKMYLQKTKQWEGETPHSYRSGCALTLSWLGISNEQIKTHVGWKSDTMLQHYTKANEMCNLSSSAQAMSKCTTLLDSSLCDKLKQYKDFHHFPKVVP